MGQFFSGGGLEAGEPVHRDDLDRVVPLLGTLSEPGLERRPGAALDHGQQSSWPFLSRIGVRPMKTVSVSV